MSLNFFCRTHQKNRFLFYIQTVMPYRSVTLTEVTKGIEEIRKGFCTFCHCHSTQGKGINREGRRASRGRGGSKVQPFPPLDRPVSAALMGRFPKGGRGQEDCTRWRERLRKSLSRWRSVRCTNSAQRRHADGDKFFQGSESSSARFAEAGGRP